MTSYHFASVIVDCPFDLPGLAIASEPPGVVVRVNNAQMQPLALDWVGVGSSVTSLQRCGFAGPTLVMEFDLDGTVRIEINPDDDTIVLTDPHQSDRAAVEHFIADAALPHYLALKGTIVLHASAVEWHGRALVALGDSGTGKSTLASSLLQAGGRLIADDAVVVSDDPTVGLCVHPIGRDLRLFDDSVEATFDVEPGKRRVGAHTKKSHVEISSSKYAPRNEPVPLGAVFGLGRDQDITGPIALGAGERVAAFERAFFGALGSSRNRATRFDAMTELAERVPVWSIGIEWTAAGTQRAIAQMRTAHADVASPGSSQAS